MEDYKEEVKKIYRKAAQLNLYILRCDVKKERLLHELEEIKESIEKLIARAKVI